jgi:hypothetical protein
MKSPFFRARASLKAAPIFFQADLAGQGFQFAQGEQFEEFSVEKCSI